MSVTSKSRAARLAGTVIAAGAVAMGSAAVAGTVTLQDNYLGGLNTYNNADVIGDASVFDIQNAVVTRVGPGQDTLQVTINTNFAGKPGTAAADGTGYGSLFITPGFNTWHPTGSGPQFATDSYTPGEWADAVTIPTNPGSSSGTSGLYATSTGSVVMSNVFGDQITYPNAGNNGYYFRQGQAVQFTPGAAPALYAASWSTGPGQVVFDIVDNGALGDNFSLSWAMTCANDVIQGDVAGVPEPATWAMLIAGFGMVGFVVRRRRGEALTSQPA
jgi:hypothetical protein